jgi:iron-sulfur cluster insertion protein
MINLTPTAQAQIDILIKQENDPNLRLRMYVQGGGCSGFSYGFEITDDKSEDDWEIPVISTSILIDPISMQYLEGITLDFKDDINGARFAIQNPKAASTCGCGSSFSPY